MPTWRNMDVNRRQYCPSAIRGPNMAPKSSSTSGFSEPPMPWERPEISNTTQIRKLAASSSHVR